MKKTILLYCLLLCHSLLVAQNSKVLVASHRGDWRNYADNCIEGIESCIRMGVDIVEIDMALTKDSVLVLMHDRTVDRTTNGKGWVSDFTLAEIKQLRLKNGLGRVTDFQIPTLEEAMTAAKGKIIVNIDKGDTYFNEVYTLLEKTGTIRQALIKSNKPYEELKEQCGENLDKMMFMPIVNIKRETTIDSIASLLNKKYPYYEICFSEENRELLLQVKEIIHGNRSVI